MHQCFSVPLDTARLSPGLQTILKESGADSVGRLLSQLGAPASSSWSLLSALTDQQKGEMESLLKTLGYAREDCLTLAGLYGPWREDLLNAAAESVFGLDSALLLNLPEELLGDVLDLISAGDAWQEVCPNVVPTPQMQGVLDLCFRYQYSDSWASSSLGIAPEDLPLLKRITLGQIGEACSSYAWHLVDLEPPAPLDRKGTAWYSRMLSAAFPDTCGASFFRTWAPGTSPGDTDAIMQALARSVMPETLHAMDWEAFLAYWEKSPPRVSDIAQEKKIPVWEQERFRLGLLDSLKFQPVQDLVLHPGSLLPRTVWERRADGSIGDAQLRCMPLSLLRLPPQVTDLFASLGITTAEQMLLMEFLLPETEARLEEKAGVWVRILHGICMMPPFQQLQPGLTVMDMPAAELFPQYWTLFCRILESAGGEEGKKWTSSTDRAFRQGVASLLGRYIRGQNPDAEQLLSPEDSEILDAWAHAFFLDRDAFLQLAGDSGPEAASALLDSAMQHACRQCLAIAEEVSALSRPDLLALTGISPEEDSMPQEEEPEEEEDEMDEEEEDESPVRTGPSRNTSKKKLAAMKRRGRKGKRR